MTPPPPGSSADSAAARGGSSSRTEGGSGERPPAPPRWASGARGWLAAGLCVLASTGALLHLAFRSARAPVLAAPRPGVAFEDRFDRSSIGPGYFTTGMHWRLHRGELWAPGAKNNPLWLELRLPRDVAVELDARSETTAGDRSGDIKLEIFGDGRNHASGYVCIFGGWGNTVSVVARLDEHGADRKERRDRKVEPGRTYHMRLERRGGALRWLVDGQLFMEYDDPRPLAGEGHDRFAFSGWASDVFFDNLIVAPL